MSFEVCSFHWWLHPGFNARCAEEFHDQAGAPSPVASIYSGPVKALCSIEDLSCRYMEYGAAFIHNKSVSLTKPYLTC